MIERFELEKSLWTQEDFKEMGWHDATIYSMCFEKKEGVWTGDLLFDIDYIFKWVDPDRQSGSFSFWVAPCTLIFEEAFELKMNLDSENFSIEGFEIADLNLVKKERQGSTERFYWNMELQHGKIDFVSNGLKQIVRKHPIHLHGQQLTLQERGGISFSRIRAGD